MNSSLVGRTIFLLNQCANQRSVGLCTSSILLKRDKFSLKSIGKGSSSAGTGTKKAPSYNKYGGSKESPVTLYQLSSNKDDIFEKRTESRHKSMIENTLQTSIENLILSGDIDSRLTGCPIEITGVDMTSNFSCATVFWRLDEWRGSWTEDDVERLLSENLAFIRKMLPAYHSMTRTPSVTFSKCSAAVKDKLINEAFHKIDNDKDS